MSYERKRARDLALLDAVEASPRRTFSGEVWRACREGRDPVLGAASHSRWCNGEFDVLYTALERDGAVAEVQAYLDLQPVFPSKLAIVAHRLAVRAGALLDLTADGVLEPLGIDPARYRERRYEPMQAVADAAYFLGFEGLLAPSARYPCSNLVLFTDHLPTDAVALVESEPQTIDWASWRRARKAAQDRKS